MKAIDTRLGDKLYFKIGEVSKLVGVKPYVLRYWETEFPELNPEKTTTGQRTYSRDDVHLSALIDELVHERRYTIEGARNVLKEIKGNWEDGLAQLDATTGDSTPPDPGTDREIERLKRENSRLLNLVDAQDKQIRNLKTNYLKLSKEVLQHQKEKSSMAESLTRELKALRSIAIQTRPTTTIQSD